MTQSSAIGIFGGTFDPIHFGHIEPVMQAAQQLNLDRIALIPCHIPSHKAPSAVASEHRLAMVRLVCQEYPIFYADDREIKRNKPTYSIDTLRELRACHPNSPLYFFIGMDSLLNLPTWYQSSRLFDLCHFVVCQRPDINDNKSREMLHLLQQRQANTLSELRNAPNGKIYFAKTAEIAISSTELRSRLLKGLPTDNYIPQTVRNYIAQHNLYQMAGSF
jgi:nicotinate-nucleotide adenylyltransferase